MGKKERVELERMRHSTVSLLAGCSCPKGHSDRPTLPSWLETLLLGCSLPFLLLWF